MPTYLRHRARTAIALLAALATTTIAAADTITLRTSVRRPAGADVITLADVAELDGPDAARFADLEIARLDAETGAGALQISVGDVRRRLHEAGAHWGRIHLNGRAVTVRPRGDGLAGPPRAMATAEVSVPRVTGPSRSDEPQAEPAAALMASPTLRGRVAATIVRALGVPAEEVMLTFDARDADLLATPLDREVFQIDPLGSFRSDRIELGIRAWRDGAVQDRHSVRVHPLLRTEVAVLRRDVPRNDLIVAEDLEREAKWLPPGQVPLMCNPVQAVGRIASRSLHSGDVLRAKDVRAETVVERGDQLMVRCLVGGVAIAMTAEACADGALGEAVPCRKLGERQEFFATITGPGEAVVDLARPAP